MVGSRRVRRGGAPGRGGMGARGHGRVPGEDPAGGEGPGGERQGDRAARPGIRAARPDAPATAPQQAGTAPWNVMPPDPGGPSAWPWPSCGNASRSGRRGPSLWANPKPQSGSGRDGAAPPGPAAEPSGAIPLSTARGATSRSRAGGRSNRPARGGRRRAGPPADSPSAAPTRPDARGRPAAWATITPSAAVTKAGGSLRAGSGRRTARAGSGFPAPCTLVRRGEAAASPHRTAPPSPRAPADSAGTGRGSRNPGPAGAFRWVARRSCCAGPAVGVMALTLAGRPRHPPMIRRWTNPAAVPS